ncbi:HAD family hydrolase [Clostridium oryzae]|uniref:Alpha-D-glucose-1-phosphate phosphatase YihX n=1 Tax=Clostridium oryzae TaxID=1450648 RepID=A0A1V4ISH9_9CLOT|nr:HAD-IA family hydrolase [Clostridium oryzae]OPJ62863.1 alpha-D-glucose-1-phosphate phosphatase YihX [Clostridium oryzae]
MLDTIFFDLFHTLVTLDGNNSRNEYDVLNISKDEWEKYAEDKELYFLRATGKEKDPRKIIESIIDKMGLEVKDDEIDEILELRKRKFERSLLNIDTAILDVLKDIKKKGIKLCLISNADTIDVMYWKQSPLSNLFDEAIFSYEVGYLKPQAEIYNLALKSMNTIPERSIFVGDGGSDELKGAKELGIKTIFTRYLIEKEEEEYRKIKQFADYYVQDFNEILSAIDIQAAV